jgi:membrane-bound lytic murein transglycosylase D
MALRIDRAGLVLTAALTACGVTRHVVPEVRTPVEVSPRPRAVPEPLACIADPRIDQWERRLRSPRGVGDAMRADMVRGARYLPHLRPIVSESGLPLGLALLPAVESGFQPRARGRAGEVGLWQLRPATARRFGLVVTPQRDDRFVPDRATRAAARYLRFLHARYRDWPLALAAYNAGEGRVDRALTRRPRATFWELAGAGLLPRRNRDYVPRFLALVRINGGTASCDTPVTRVSRSRD